MAALTADRIDAERRRILVDRQVVEGRHGLALAPPKTGPERAPPSRGPRRDGARPQRARRAPAVRGPGRAAHGGRRLGRFLRPVLRFSSRREPTPRDAAATRPALFAVLV